MEWIFNLAKMAVIVVLLVAGVFFGVREGLLMLAEKQLLKTSEIVWTDKLTSKLYAKSCTDGQVETAQVAFTSPREYTISVVCALNQQRVQVESGVLPWMVQKKPGSAGLIFMPPTSKQLLASSVTLHLWRQDRVVRLGSELDIQRNPVAACVGYGYQCCTPPAIGAGTVAEGVVTDCAGQCFSKCKNPPVLLSLRTDPPKDQTTKKVSISGQTKSTVRIVAIMSDVDGTPPLSSIDFGDGAKDTFTKEVVEVYHEFKCPSKACTFPVKMTIKDVDGLSAPPSSNSVFLVQFSP